MRINIVQTNYDPTEIERLTEILNDVGGGITCFPECFALGRSGVETLQYLNKVSDETERIIETVKKTGKTVILPLIEWHPVMRNRFYNTVYVIHNGDVIGTYRRVVIHPMEKPFIQSGKEFPVFEFDDTTFGVLICFEIAFPELTRIIALKGVERLATSDISGEVWSFHHAEKPSMRVKTRRRLPPLISIWKRS